MGNAKVVPALEKQELAELIDTFYYSEAPF